YLIIQPTAVSAGSSATLTRGPAAMLHSVAPGRGGGFTYATPPSGHSTIWSARPPTCRQANACPYSCSSTIRNSARYSSTFQVSDPYLPARLWISTIATRNHDQWRYTSTPAKRNKRMEPRDVTRATIAFLEWLVAGDYCQRGIK